MDKSLRAVVAWGFWAASTQVVHASAMPSYSCTFTEPFITLESYPGGARFNTPDAQGTVLSPSLDASGAVTQISGIMPDGKTFILRITKEVSGDGMSDMMRPYKGVVTGSYVSAPLRGACLRFPDGTSPRPVKGVLSDDVLNVRSRPTARAKIVGGVASGGTLWAFPEDLVRGWARVAAPAFPKGGAGMVGIVQGWANAKFLGNAASY
jgi:uncharacterized membrane protein